MENQEPLIVTDVHPGSTPLYLGLHYLKANELDTAQVVIFTPLETYYTEKEDEDEEESNQVHVNLCVDEWLVQNGNLGKIARLLNRIQIVRVKDLAQLAVCLATFPATNLGQTTQPALLIIRDMSLLSTSSVPQAPASPTRSDSGHSLDSMAEKRLSAHVAIIGHALAAVDHLTGSRLLVLDAGLELPSVKILGCYLQERPLLSNP